MKVFVFIKILEIENLSASFIKVLTACVESYLSQFDNLLIIGDFNIEEKEKIFEDFMQNLDMDNIVKEPPCFKHPDNPSCIALILTNRKQYLQNTTVVETSISDFHKMVVAVIKSHYIKAKPRVISYRDNKEFDQDKFTSNLEIIATQLRHNSIDHSCFEKAFTELLEILAPCKTKHVRANEASLLNKNIKK